MPDYDFRALSPIDFEMLTRDLLNADLGLQLVSFGVGPDGGVDLRDARSDRRVVVQCKHRPDATKSALVLMARSEAARWNPDQMASYLFVVSSTISPRGEIEIVSALSPLPVSNTSLWHQGAINAALGRNPQVERDHFKLWLSSATALERISSASQWQRSEELLQRVTDRVRLYVHTPAYSAAMKKLEQEHIVLISGAPGVGKSTLAEMILLTLWHDGWTVVNIASDIDEAWRQVRTSKDKVVFYYDDFLGQTSTAELQKNEGSGIAFLVDRLRRGNGNQLLVLTTREQVLNQARHGDDDRVRRLADEDSKLRVELDKVSRIARAQMLFNHLHFGFNDEGSRAVLSVDDRYRRVVDHPGFNPRILESVILGQNHSTVDEFYGSLFHALDHPDSIWAASFQQLSKTAAAILFQLAVSQSSSMSVQALYDAVSPDDPREWLPALKVLENTWVRLSPAAGAAEQVSLFDPSRRDFLLDLLSRPGYFDAVLDNISSLGQIVYIFRLAGLMGNRIDPVGSVESPPIREAAINRAGDVDGIVYEVAVTQLSRASRAEAALQIRNRTPHPGSSPKTYPGSVSETFRERFTMLADLASLCFGMELSTPQAEGYLQGQLAFFDDGVSNPSVLASPQLFGLAARLASESAPDWAIDYAIVIADLAFDAYADSDELKLFSSLPAWFRDGPYRERGRDKLRNALESELDAIGQQDDRDLMAQWLEDIASLAEEHGVSLYLDSLLEQIEDMDPVERDVSRFTATATLPGHIGNGTDEELQALFAKLNR